MRRSRKPLSRAARLTKEWIASTTVETANPTYASAFQLNAQAATASWILDPDEAVAAFDEPTILRTRVAITPAFDSVSAANKAGGVRIGIIVCSEIPTGNMLFVNGYEDWVWWSEWVIVPTSAAATAGQPTFTTQEQWDDVKTKRRVEAGNGICLVAFNVSPGSIVRFHAAVRMLLGH